MSKGRGYESAARRWEGIGPYYAMFPTQFADAVVSEHTSRDDYVLDPFAGRGTAVFSASSQGRKGLGIEINPVGWCYAKTKVAPAPKEAVLERISAIAEASRAEHDSAMGLPAFFHHCFSLKVREFLLAARHLLNWKEDQVDRTAMAFLLVYLHGKRDASLSNQMRQTKAMAPDYAVRWWQDRGMAAPDVDPVNFFAKRVAWRYAKGVPGESTSEVYLGNAEERLVDVCEVLSAERKKVSLILTSPPYFRLTNYHYDQWLRLWILGGEPNARRVPGSTELQGKFENPQRYERLLRRVFLEASRTLADDGVVYVRTGRGSVTLEATREALKAAFPRHELAETDRPYTRPTQTSLFGDSNPKAGEVDLVMLPSS